MCDNTVESYSKTCGIAWLSGSNPAKSHMFSATQWYCATDNYVFAHEVGHNLGCDHDRGTGR